MVRERDELKTKLRDHRRSNPNCSIRSSDQYIDLLDEDLPRPIQIQTRRLTTSTKIPSSVVGASPPLSRSFSCPETSAASLSRPQWIENVEDNIELSSTSDEEEEEEEEEGEEEQEDDEPTEAVFSPHDFFSFTDLGIAESSRDYTQDLSLMDDQPPLDLFHFEEQPDILDNIEEDPFSLLDDLSSSLSTQVFDRSVGTDFPKNLKSSAGVDFTPITGFDSSSQSSSTARPTVHDMVDASGTYYEDQQSEAIDLSKPRTTLPTTDPSSIRVSTSVDRIEQKVPGPAKMQEFEGNIPLHVHNFIVGEK